MKSGKLQLIAYLLFWLSLTGVYAQNKLFVKEKSGSRTTFTLSDIDKLTFSAGNVNINNINGSTNIFILSNIQNINFSDLTYNADIKDANKDVSVYPNPAKDQICLQYNVATTKDVRLQIIDLQGKVVFQKTLCNTPGVNYEIIPVNKFQCGLFLCRLQMGQEFIDVKFLKN